MDLENANLSRHERLAGWRARLPSEAVPPRDPPGDPERRAQPELVRGQDPRVDGAVRGDQATDRDGTHRARGPADPFSGDRGRSRVHPGPSREGRRWSGARLGPRRRDRLLEALTNRYGATPQRALLTDPIA